MIDALNSATHSARQTARDYRELGWQSQEDLGIWAMREKLLNHPWQVIASCETVPPPLLVRVIAAKIAHYAFVADDASRARAAAGRCFLRGPACDDHQRSQPSRERQLAHTSREELLGIDLHKICSSDAAAALVEQFDRAPKGEAATAVVRTIQRNKDGVA